MSCVLRASRIPISLERPTASSKGVTVIASAPPTAAAKHAVVARSIFTQESVLVIIAFAVSAWIATELLEGDAPHADIIRAQQTRAARILAVFINWSGPTVSVISSFFATSLMLNPASRRARIQRTPADNMAPSSWLSDAPPFAQTDPSMAIGITLGNLEATSFAMSAHCFISRSRGETDRPVRASRPTGSSPR